MVNEINDSMRQYWKANESIVNNKPKNPSRKIVRLPDTGKMILVATGVLVVLVAIGQMM